MNTQLVTELKKAYGPLEWYANPIKGISGEGWFLLEIHPLPPPNEVEMVAADICCNKKISVFEGKVRHSNDCREQKHSFSQNLRNVFDVIEFLEDDKYKVAVHPGLRDSYNGQPIAIALEPVITYFTFPDHPHLNAGSSISVDGVDLSLPDSFCYIEDVSQLGSNDYDRLLNAFDEITVWLFRHQIWLATREVYKKGIWIGPQGKPLPPERYPAFINPMGNCRCGSKDSYINCCMPRDLITHAKIVSKKYNITLQKSVDFLKGQYRKRWNSDVYEPQNLTLKRLSRSLA